MLSKTRFVYLKLHVESKKCFSIALYASILCLCAFLITASKPSFGQDNVFTPVCHSVHWVGGVSV